MAGLSNELTEALAKAKAWFDGLSPTEKAAHREAQLQSFIRSSTLIDEGSDEAKARQSAYWKRHDPADPYRWIGEGDPPRRWFAGNAMVYRTADDHFDD